MEVEDVENMVSASSMILNSVGSHQNEVLSAEDLAWVESCLNNDFDISDSNWTPLKKALLEIINSQTQSFSTDVDEDIDIIPSSEETPIESVDQECLTSYVSYAPSTIPINIAAEMSAGENPDNEINVPSSNFQRNPFLPTYKEDLKESETTDFGLNVDFPFHEAEQAPGTIFKIWDLDIPSEEGELFQQLDKALSENSFQTVPASFDDSENLKDLKEGSLDDLIAGIADLSLNNLV